MEVFTQRVFQIRKTLKSLSLFSVAGFVMLMTSSLAWGQIIAGYDVTGPSGAPVTAPATTIGANVIASSITRGPGAPPSTATNSFRTQGFRNDGISTANTDYFQVTLAATAGNKLSLSAIDANLNGTTSFAASPGVTSQFAYSLDGTNFILIGSPQTIAGVPQSLATIDLTGIAALQNVPSNVTVTLRYFASGQTTTGGFGFFSATPGTNGLTISGTTAPAGSTAAMVNVGGRVTDAKRRGIPAVLVTVTDGNGEKHSTYTDSFGYYVFEEFEVGQTLIFEVEAKRYTFTQATQVLSLTGEETTVNFTAHQSRRLL